jgi:hypothetical protein
MPLLILQQNRIGISAIKETLPQYFMEFYNLLISLSLDIII